MLNRFNLGTKLMASFVLVAIIVIIVAGVGYFNMQMIQAGALVLYRDRLSPIKQLGSIQTGIYELRSDVLIAALVPSQRQTVADVIKTPLNEIDNSLTNFRLAATLQSSEQKQLDIFDPAWKAYQQRMNEAVDKLNSGDVDGAKTILSDPATEELHATMDGALDVLLEINQTAADDVYTLNKQIFEGSKLGLIILALIGLITALFLGRALTLSIIRPLALVKQASQQIARSDLDALSKKFESLAKGDLTRSFYLSTQPVAINSKDEIGELGAAFNDMIVHLQEMGQSFSVMVSSLRTLVSNLSRNANNLSLASNELAQAAAEAGQTTMQIATTM